MNKSILVIFINILLFTLILSCASIKKMNVPVQKDESTVRFKKTEIWLKSGSIIKADNTILNKKTRTISFKSDEDSVKIGMSEVESLKYSNTTLRGQLAGLGAALGVIIAVNNSKGYVKGEFISGSDKSLYSYILGFPLGFFIGDRIGKKIYIKWKEFDLDSFRQPTIRNDIIPTGRKFGLSIQIPFR